MISFRFHLVSVVAVFLALGLGVLSGTTVLNRGIVAGLEEQTTQLEAGRQALREQVSELQRQAEQWGRFGQDLVPYLVDGRLGGRTVVLLTQEGTDEQAVASAQDGLEAAGATILSLLEVTDRMALPTEADRAELAATVGASALDEPETLKALAAGELADQLAYGSDRADVLGPLIDGGFVVNLGPNLGEAQLQEVSEADAVVLVAGGPEMAPPRADRFLIPFVRAASQSGLSVAAAEPLETEFEFVTVLRDDSLVRDGIVTQDNVDQLPGMFGLVLGLDKLLELGQGGHFGVKDGASGVIPPPPA